MKRLAPLLSVIALNMTSALAENSLPDTAVEPAEAMDQLSPLIGAWLAVTEMITPEGEWVEQNRDRVEFIPSLNGLMLSESHLERLSGTGFILETDFSFDQYRDVYRVAAVDNTWGLMDIYEGNITNGALQITNVRAGTSFPLQDGKEMNFRLTIALSGDRRVTTIDQSTDAGESWNPFFRITYTRSNP